MKRKDRGGADLGNVLSVVEARKHFSRISEVFEEDKTFGSVTVTKRGKPVMAIVDWDLYESILETLEIMSDKELMKQLRKSIKQADRGELIPIKDVKI